MMSRRILRNVRYAVEGQHTDGVFAAAEGTYKLHYGNWVLVAFGTYRSRYTEARDYIKTFVAWAYMFVRTEHVFAYTQLFRTVVDYTQQFFGIQLDVKFGSLDHAACIANAYEAVWPGITLLDCYPHVSRKCREKVSLLEPAEHAQEYYRANIEINIKQMHLARPPDEFLALSKKCLQRWRDDGQDAYANWFKKVYLADKWARWYATSGSPGVVPSQNPLESHNGVLKTCGVNAKRVKTGVMLNKSMPGILAVASRDTPKSPFSHYCEGPIPSSIVYQATKYIAPASHFTKFRYINRKRFVRSVFFNATQFMVSSSQSSAEAITSERIERYTNAKQGNIPEESAVNDINLEYLSLHEVEFLNPEEAEGFTLPLQPVVSTDKMKEIRAIYRCDCKMFWTTGWTCSHVIATMALMKQFELKVAMTELPTRKVSGEQRKIPGALYVDSPDSRTFTKPNLLKKFVDKPLYPYGWRLAKGIIFEEDGQEWTQYVIGIIEGHQTQNRGKGVIFKWNVTFRDGEEKSYECEELVDQLLISRRGGLDITSSASTDSVSLLE